ncbi:MAG: transposase [Alphaproteobacteria bacterium]|nr:transposase [Alphaproteobacteria bacterium]
MARQARIVIEDTPHHIMQRGNRAEPVFFQKGDYQSYLDIVTGQLDNAKIDLLSYCLLPNQVHLLILPKDASLIARAIGEAHRRYTNLINRKQGWSGHLFQNRFFSYAMDEQHALRASRFIETLPITNGITDKPENYLWSSARSRIKIIDNPLLTNFPSFSSIPDWNNFLSRPMDTGELKTIQTHLQTGRPRGSDLFLDKIEENIGRPVRPQKRGRKPKKIKVA